MLHIAYVGFCWPQRDIYTNSTVPTVTYQHFQLSSDLYEEMGK